MENRALAEQRLDRAFGALADPSRRAILARLTAGEAGVLELAEPLPISQPAVSKHLRVLESAGMVSRHRRAKQHLCRLEAGRMKELFDWIGGYRRFWEESFSRLDDFLEAMETDDRR